MIPIIAYVFLLAVIIFIIYGVKEMFTDTTRFIEKENAEFRGINLLGENSNDGHFAAESSAVCREVCQRNPECKGYSFYHPGQRCYMFMSGDFVEGRPGFYSGKKLEN